jgi:hypothetical protein
VNLLVCLGTLTRVNESQSEVSTISTTMIHGLDTELFPPDSLALLLSRTSSLWLFGCSLLSSMR